MRMLSSTLRRNTCNSAFQNFQKCLLYTLSGNITSDGNILGFTCDLVDLIYINNSVLRSVNIIISSLDDLQKNILNIFTYISCLCQGSGVCNGKRYILRLLPVSVPEGSYRNRSVLTSECYSSAIPHHSYLHQK